MNRIFPTASASALEVTRDGENIVVSLELPQTVVDLPPDRVLKLTVDEDGWLRNDTAVFVRAVPTQGGGVRLVVKGATVRWPATDEEGASDMNNFIIESAPSSAMRDHRSDMRLSRSDDDFDYYDRIANEAVNAPTAPSVVDREIASFKAKMTAQIRHLAVGHEMTDHVQNADRRCDMLRRIAGHIGAVCLERLQADDDAVVRCDKLAATMDTASSVLSELADDLMATGRTDTSERHERNGLTAAEMIEAFDIPEREGDSRGKNVVLWPRLVDDVSPSSTSTCAPLSKDASELRKETFDIVDALFALRDRFRTATSDALKLPEFPAWMEAALADVEHVSREMAYRADIVWARRQVARIDAIVGNAPVAVKTTDATRSRVGV